MKRASLALASLILTAVAPVLAHHSFLAEYDGDKQVTITGVVTEVDWRNPHSHFYLDVTKPDGTIDKWKFEAFPPNMLLRNGWKRDDDTEAGHEGHDLRLAGARRIEPGALASDHV